MNGYVLMFQPKNDPLGYYEVTRENVLKTFKTFQPTESGFVYVMLNKNGVLYSTNHERYVEVKGK